MTKEIVRELLNGEWVTAVRDSGGAGGGSVSEITSTDMSVTITDPTGPTVDLSVPGGGGGATLISVTFSPADVAAQWDTMLSLAAMEVTDIAAGDWVIFSTEEVNTLDQNFYVNAGAVYTSGASTSDVNDNSDNAPPIAPTTWIVGTFGDTNLIPAGSAMTVQRAAAGCSFYVVLAGDDSPTTGVYTFTVLRFPAP